MGMVKIEHRILVGTQRVRDRPTLRRAVRPTVADPFWLSPTSGLGFAATQDADTVDGFPG